MPLVARDVAQGSSPPDDEACPLTLDLSRSQSSDSHSSFRNGSVSAIPYATPVEWDVYKDKIRTLRLVKRWKLREIVRYMEQAHHFRATEKMYKDRFHKWGFGVYRARRTTPAVPSRRKRRSRSKPATATSACGDPSTMDHNPTGDSGTGPAPADNSETEDFSELGEFADDNLVDELGSHVSNPGSWTCPKDAELTISPATLHQPVTQLSLRGEGRIGSCIISLLRAAMLSIGENRPVGDIWDFIAFNSLRHHPAEFFRSTLSEGFESLRQIKSSLGGNPDPWQRKLLRRTYKERQRLLVNDSWICIGPLVREFKPLMVVDLLKALLKIESADIAGAIFFKLVTDARATYGADSPFSKLIKMFHDVFLEENLAGLHTVVRRVFASVPDIACKLLGRTSLIAHFLIALTEARTADGRDVASLLEDMREPIVSTKDDLKTIRRKLTVLYFVAGNFKKTLGATDDRVLKETAAAAQAAELLRERMEQQDGDTPRLAHYYLRGTYKLWADALHDRAIAAADAGVASSASSPASYYTAASTVPNDSLDAARARLLLGNPLFRLATVYLEKSLTHHVVLTSGKDPETLRLRARLRDWYTQLGDFRAADGLRECAVVA